MTKNNKKLSIIRFFIQFLKYQGFVLDLPRIKYFDANENFIKKIISKCQNKSKYSTLPNLKKNVFHFHDSLISNHTYPTTPFNLLFIT